MLMLAFGTSSCSDNETAEFAYVLECSEDLLKFVTPEVTVTNADGKEETTVISDNDWVKSNVELEMSDGGVNIRKSVAGYAWVKHIYASNWDVKSSMIIKYIKKENIPALKFQDSFIFSHNLSCSVTAQKKKKKFGSIQNDLDVGGDLITIGISKIVPASEVNDYIDNLISNPDKKSYYVNGDGEIKEGL